MWPSASTAPAHSSRRVSCISFGIDSPSAGRPCAAAQRPGFRNFPSSASAPTCRSSREMYDMDVQGGRARTRARVTRLARVAAMLVVVAAAGLVSAPATSPRAAGAATTPFALGPLMSGGSAPMTLAPLRGTSEAFSGAAVATGLLPGGGTQIAVGAMNGCVLIYQLANLAQAPVCINTGAGPVQATPVLADLDHDGYTDMVTANASTGWVLAYRGSANGLAKTPFFSQNTTVNARGPGEFATPAVGDLDGDGNLDIVAASLNHDVF